MYGLQAELQMMELRDDRQPAQTAERLLECKSTKFNGTKIEPKQLSEA